MATKPNDDSMKQDAKQQPTTQQPTTQEQQEQGGVHDRQDGQINSPAGAGPLPATDAELASNQKPHQRPAQSNDNT